MNTEKGTSKKAKSYRPKILSFNSTLHGLDIAGQKNILWPCHAFTVTIPQKKKSALNIFEQTVLKLIELRSSDSEKIAKITCLDEEIVSFIQNRLRQLKLINERNELLEGGKSLLASWESGTLEDVENVVATVFIDLMSGKLLPFITTEQLHYKKFYFKKTIEVKDNNNDDDTKDDKEKKIDTLVNFFLNPTSNKWIEALEIKIVEHDLKRKKPTPRDVVKAISEYKKNYQRHALLSSRLNQGLPYVPRDEAISVGATPELVYLHCNVIIQKGNAEDILVTDGYGLGFSGSFAEQLRLQNFSWLTKLKETATEDKTTVKNKEEKAMEYQLLKYKNISEKIKKCKVLLDELAELKTDTKDSNREYQRKVESGIKNLYAAMEWTLRQVVVDFPSNQWQQIYVNNDYTTNEKLLWGFAEKIGVSITEKNRKLLQVKPGAFKQIFEGKAELQPLLALAITAANNAPLHPMHALVEKYPKFLDVLLELKRYRDPIKHGSIEKFALEREELKAEYDKILPIILTLIPKVSDDLGIKTKPFAMDDLYQKRLKATIELEKQLGFFFINNLGFNIKESLIRTEMLLAKYTDDNSADIVDYYAAAMQQMLLNVAKEKMYRIEDANNIQDIALSKLVSSGFYTNKSDISASLSNVQSILFTNALKGYNSSLGAQLLVFMLLSSKEELEQLRASIPDFIELILKLLELRGHGNGSTTGLTREGMILLRNKMFKAVKKIDEVY